MRRFFTPALLLLLPFALFLAFFSPAMLAIGNPGWLIRGTDNGENALGAHAYWHDRAAGASLKTGLLNAPEGVPVLYTDSNPLLTLLAKPFARLLPADAQLVGPFILFSLILQAVFAWLLLRRHAPGPVALWAGVILLAFPPTLFNRFVHVNLMAHWTILAALWLAVDAERARHLRWWAPLIAVTTLVHSYLLVMVAAIWASTLLTRFTEGPRRARLVVLAEGVAMLAMVALLAWWLGVGDQAPAGNYGSYAMPLDALWNPGLPNFSNLLPTHDRGAARGFEGFQYMGAGGLLLVLGAAVIAWRTPARDGERIALRGLRALVPGLVVLATLAIARMALPDIVVTILDPVRASGRLLWPVGYVFVLLAVLAVYRLSAERAGLALIGIIALQVVDLAGMADAVRAQNKEAAHHRLYVRTLDPRWEQLVAHARSIAFMPGEVTYDLALFQEVTWRAAKVGTPVTSVYAARTSRATRRRLDAEAAAFDRGDLVPGRLYVLFAGMKPPAAAAPNVRTIDGVTVIVPLRP